MSESTKGIHVQGIYIILVPIITLIGGYFLNEPINKAFFPKYANIGGVWKAHGDLLMHCEVSTVRDTFYINLRGEYTSGETWFIGGQGKIDRNSGSFTGTMKIGTGSATPIWGHAETAGSDQLGVTVFLDREHTRSPLTYAFIREISSSLENLKNDKTE